MASKLMSFLLLIVVLIATCHCAPWESVGGFHLGGNSRLNIGGSGGGLFGLRGLWTGKGDAGFYGHLNDNYFGGNAAGMATGGMTVGVGSKGIVLDKIADVGGNYGLYSGDKAKRLKELYNFDNIY